MGWKEILSKRLAPDTEPGLTDHQQILAYLEELCRLRTPCQLKFRKDDLAPAAVKIESINEEQQAFTVSLSRALPAGIEDQPSLELTFPLERGRFRCSVFFLQRGGYLQAILGLPLRIKQAERRVGPRARFGSRERASVTLIENLGSGLGATGKLMTLGMGGLSVRVDRMISIADDRRISPSSAPFEKGQKFLLLRINDLPRSPMVECGASLAFAATTAEGPVLGLQFEGLGSLETRILEQVMQRRLPRTGQVFPVKVRRAHLSLEDLDAGGAEGEWEDPDDVPEAPAEAGPGEADDPESDAGDWPDRSSPQEKVKRLKRAGRCLLLVLTEDLDRAILAGTLIVDGFRRVKEARNFTAAVEVLRTVQPDLVILDQRIGVHDAQQFLEKLRANGLGSDIPVVMLAEKPDVRTALMAKAARIGHVEAKPVDYDGSLRAALERLLGV